MPEKYGCETVTPYSLFTAYQSLNGICPQFSVTAHGTEKHIMGFRSHPKRQEDGSGKRKYSSVLFISMILC